MYIESQYTMLSIQTLTIYDISSMWSAVDPDSVLLVYVGINLYIHYVDILCIYSMYTVFICSLNV